MFEFQNAFKKKKKPLQLTPLSETKWIVNSLVPGKNSLIKKERRRNSISRFFKTKLMTSNCQFKKTIFFIEIHVENENSPPKNVTNKHKNFITPWANIFHFKYKIQKSLHTYLNKKTIQTCQTKRRYINMLKTLSWNDSNSNLELGGKIARATSTLPRGQLDTESWERYLTRTSDASQDRETRTNFLDQR